MNAKFLTCCLLGLLCGLAQNAGANSLRCGTHLIQDGERHGPSKYEVLKKCGNPESRMGNTWVYKSGGRTLFLRFSGSGMLLTIRDEQDH